MQLKNAEQQSVLPAPDKSCSVGVSGDCQVKSDFSDTLVKSKSKTKNNKSINNKHKPRECKSCLIGPPGPPGCSVSHFSEYPLSSSSPVVLDHHLFTVLPKHPNVFVCCAYCKKTMSSQHLKFYMEYPHARRRYTPMCENCYG